MKLAALLNPWVSVTHPDCDLQGIDHDSRQIKPGYLFAAYKGHTHDGRLYIQQAIDAGAVAIIYEPGLSLPLDSTIPCIPIPNLARELGAIARRYYGDPAHAMTITGVTGTNGKTTIAYQLAQAHALLGQSAAYIGTLGAGDVQHLTPLCNTTPDALRLQQLLHDFKERHVNELAMEVSSHALSEGRVDGIAFSQAIYTNLTHEHLDYHHTMEAYAAAKARLFTTDGLRYAVINGDDAHASVMKAGIKHGCQTITYGLTAGCDVHALDIALSMHGSEVEVVSPWGRHTITLNALGLFNVYNGLAVFSSLLAHGYPVDAVVRVMGQLKASPGRMEVVSQAPCVIVDYAHTPDALENALRTLSKLKKKHLWVVFGCGGDRDKTKRPVMGRIASQYADYILLTSDNPRSEDPHAIMADIAAGLLSQASVEMISDRHAAIHKVLALAAHDDMVLIAGKGHETYQQIGDRRYVFSDQAVVRDFRK